MADTAEGPWSEDTLEARDPQESEVLVPGFFAAVPGERKGGPKPSVAFASPVATALSVDAEKHGGEREPLTCSTSSGKSWRSKTSASSSSVCQDRRGKSRVANLLSSRWSKAEAVEAKAPRPAESRRAYTNSNMPQDYLWLESVLESIARNQAAALDCRDTATGQVFVPVFLVLGACPNVFCGMQAIMYSVNMEGEVDFWWVKPGKSESASGEAGVETSTLSRHAKGPHKNDPGRSKPFYKPLADLFRKEQVVGGFRFGIEQGEHGKSSRAFLEQTQASGGQPKRQYMHLVWQEDWTSNPFSRSKYIKGKIVYQKDPQTLQFHARQYHILNGTITVSHEEEPPFGSLLPGEEIKDLRAD